MSEAISISNPWAAPAEALPADGREDSLSPRDWAKARQRMELYLEALAVPADNREPLIDKALGLAESRGPESANLTQAMTALFYVLTERAASAGDEMNDDLSPAFFFHRSMLPGERASLDVERGHMVPTVHTPATHTSLRDATSEWLEKMTEAHSELNRTNPV